MISQFFYYFHFKKKGQLGTSCPYFFAVVKLLFCYPFYIAGQQPIKRLQLLTANGAQEGPKKAYIIFYAFAEKSNSTNKINKHNTKTLQKTY